MFLFYPYTVRRMAAHGTTYRLQHFVTIQPEQWKVPHFCEVEYSAVDQRYAGNHFYRKTAFAQISPLTKAGALPSAAGSFYDATENHVLSIKWQRASLAKMEEYFMKSSIRNEIKMCIRDSLPTVWMIPTWQRRWKPRWRAFCCGLLRDCSGW